MKTTPARNIDEYIISFPEDIRTRLEELRFIIKAAAPGATEAIKYSIPTFKLNGDLVHFGVYKKHIRFYTAHIDLKEFKGEIAIYEVTNDTLQFPLDKPLPLDLITRIVKFRVKGNLEKATKKVR